MSLSGPETARPSQVCIETIRMNLKANLRNSGATRRFCVAALALYAILSVAPSTSAANTIEGQVLSGGAPIAKSTVTLWAASTDAPKQLAQTQTGDDGRFTLSPSAAGGDGSVLYIVAKGGEPAVNKGGGDNPAIALIFVIGSKPP